MKISSCFFERMQFNIRQKISETSDILEMVFAPALLVKYLSRDYLHKSSLDVILVSKNNTAQLYFRKTFLGIIGVHLRMALTFTDFELTPTEVKSIRPFVRDL